MASKSNFEITILSAKNIVMLIPSMGRKYFNPDLASPLFTTPITNEERKAVTAKNAMEKYITKLTEIGT